MCALSIFQKLPDIVVQCIVNQIAFGATHPQFAHGALPYNACQDIHSLLHTSRIWRKTALETGLQVCNITMVSPSAQAIDFPLLRVGSYLPLSTICDKVRSLQVTIGSKVPMSQLHLSMINNSIIFSQLKHLEVAVIVRYPVELGQHEISKIMHSLPQFLPQLVAESCPITITYGDESHSIGYSMLEFLDSTVNALYSQNYIEKCVHIDYLDPFNFTPLTGLSSIKLIMCEGELLGLELIRANVGTLKELYLMTFSNQILDLMAVNRNNKAIVYLNLQKLCVEPSSSTVDLNPVAVPKRCVPYPNLRHLRVYSMYPFASDIAFRGNRKTLEYLYISVDKQTAADIFQSRMFKEKTHRNLKQLSIFHSDDVERVDEVLMGKLIFNIAANLEVITITDQCQTDTFFMDIPLSTDLQRLRQLNIVSTAMSFSNLVQLLRSIPSIEGIACRQISMCQDMEAIEPDLCADYVFEKFHPVGKHFSKLSVREVDQVAVFLLIAIICPGFRHVQVPHRYAYKCQEEVNIQSTDGAFGKYASQIANLTISS